MLLKTMWWRVDSGRCATAVATLMSAAVLLTAMSATAARAQQNGGGGFNERGGGGGRQNRLQGNDAATTLGGVRGTRATLQTDRIQYAPGRGVLIQMQLINDTNGNLRAGYSNREYDVAVRSDRTGQEVWRLSRQQRGGGTQSGEIALGPGEKKVNQEFWDQRDANGKAVAPGAYTVEAAITGKDTLRVKIFLTDRGNGNDSGGNGGGRDDNANPNIPGGGGGRPRLDDRFPGGGGQSPVSGVTGSLRVEAVPATGGGGGFSGLRFVYRVANNSRQTQTLRFSSGQQFDIAVQRVREQMAANRGPSADGNPVPTGERVWLWSQERMFTMALIDLTLRAGESRPFEAIWSLAAKDTLRPGIYSATAYLTTMASTRRGNDPRAANGEAQAGVLFRVTANGRIETLPGGGSPSGVIGGSGLGHVPNRAGGDIR